MNPEPSNTEGGVSPAIAGLLKERQKINDALTALGYVDPEAPPPAPVQEGVYPLMEVSKVPDLHVVKDEATPSAPKDGESSEEAADRIAARQRGETLTDAAMREGAMAVGDAKRQARLSDVAEDVDVDTTVPPPGTNVPPTDPTERADGQEAWRKSSDDAKRVLVALNTLKRGKIPAITTNVNGTGASISEATIRRVLYGRSAQKPESGTLMQRGLVSQANPYARGKIVYRLTPLGEQAVAFGASLARVAELEPRF